MNEIQPHAQPVQKTQPQTAPQKTLSNDVQRDEAMGALIKEATAKAGSLRLTDAESKQLTAPFADTDFREGASGNQKLIYIEHAKLRERLTSVLGLGQWCFMRRNHWMERFQTAKGQAAVRVYVEGMLIVRGCLVGEGIGDMVYYSANDAQNFGDALEGAKSAAFRRCMKEFGIGLQAWDKGFCEAWWQRKNSGNRIVRGSEVPPPREEPCADLDVLDAEMTSAPAEPTGEQFYEETGKIQYTKDGERKEDGKGLRKPHKFKVNEFWFDCWSDTEFEKAKKAASSGAQSTVVFTIKVNGQYKNNVVEEVR